MNFKQMFFKWACYQIYFIFFENKIIIFGLNYLRCIQKNKNGFYSKSEKYFH